ncbi:MAG: hypothetical protein FWD27_00090 [Coriobacteriia bacterium]|nr:hypothetical protein [Coriobacteriia bacterium]
MAKTVRQKEINFLAVLSGRRVKKKLELRSFIMPLVLLLIALVGLIIFFLLQSSAAEVKAESNEIRDYLNSPETERQLVEAAQVESDARAMSIAAEQVAVPMEYLVGYPDMSANNYSRMRAFAGPQVELSTLSYDRNTGLLAFTASSDYVLSIPTFIAQLRSSGMFSEVSYSGYSSNVTPTMQISQATNRGIGGAPVWETNYYQVGSTYPDGGAYPGGSGSQGVVSGQGTSFYTATLYAFRVECSVKPPNPAQALGIEEDLATESEVNQHG